MDLGLELGMEFGANLSVQFIALLVLAAFLAGMIDAIAGGGGLIIVPLLFLSGLDPVTAIATNKLQSTFGSLSSTLAFLRAGHVDLRRDWFAALVAAVAGLAGACLLTIASNTWLAGTMPLLLIVIAVYFGFSSAIRDRAVVARWPMWRFTLIVVPVVAAYDGFFGPGAGSFYMLGIVSLLGLAAVPAAGLTKHLNLASNAGSLIVFLVAGKAIVALGLLMGAAQFAGAHLGARLAINNGAGLIRPLLVVVSIAMALRLLLDPLNPLRVALTGFLG